MKKYFKNLLLVVLSLVLVLSFVACDNNRRSNDDDDDDDDDTSVSDKNKDDDDDDDDDDDKKGKNDKDKDDDEEDDDNEFDRDEISDDDFDDDFPSRVTTRPLPTREPSIATERPIPTVGINDEYYDDDYYVEPTASADTFEEYLISEGEETEATEYTDECIVTLKVKNDTLYFTVEMLVEVSAYEMEEFISEIEDSVDSLCDSKLGTGYKGKVKGVLKIYDIDGYLVN